MAKLFQSDANFPEFTVLTGGVTKDIGTKIGDLILIPQSTQLLGEKCIGQRTGEVLHNKPSTQVWTEGALLYFDTSALVFTTVSGATNFKAGYAARAAANPSAQGYVILAGVNLGL